MEHRNGALLALAVGLYALNSIGAPLKLIAWMGVWYFTGGDHSFYLFRNTIVRDYRWLSKGLQMLPYAYYFKLKKINCVKRFRQIVEWDPLKTLFINATNDEEWTRQRVEEYSNRVANYFLQRGFKKGDTVAFFMPNRPEYIITWFGLAKIGVIPALVNFNLRKKPLLHTIKVVKCKAIIYGLELESAIEEISEEIREYRSDFGFFHSLRGSDSVGSIASTLAPAKDLDEELKSASTAPEPSAVADSIEIGDSLCYIYTSGTTGLPKAVNITHQRQHWAAFAVRGLLGVGDSVLYSVMPLYHSSGSQIGTAASMTFGNKTVIKAKFSARNFFKDCAKYNATAANFIGEICRYLLATPPSPTDRQHSVKLMFGNGLRKNIWKEFMNRFGIERISEFYGATEGNCNVANATNQVGHIGYLGVAWPQWIREFLQPLYVVRVDQVTGEPIRDKDGFCTKADPGEPGEFIGKIVKGDPLKEFQGYKDTTATTKKIMTNVFKKGDMYFRSGDILVMDEFGNLSFKDRVGDTFRWQGENVSTNEVEGIVSAILNQPADMPTSYGVEIPNTDGRAGMLAIPVKDEAEVDLDKLQAGVAEQLPKYARPMFVRIIKEVQMTSTYKLKKNLLQEEGFDVGRISDPLYFLDPRVGKYVRIDGGLHQSIISGEVRL